jgi:hypothetical protein
MSQKLNLDLAQTLGWEKNENDPNLEPYWIEPNTERKISISSNPHPFPNYCEDLNALYEIESKLTLDQQYTYGDLLRIATENVGPKGGHFTPNGWGCFSLAHASPAQRAEALLTTLKKTP